MQIDYKIVYSSRRTLAISILPDATVIVRVPHRTSGKTIEKLVSDKSGWIMKHTENIRNKNAGNPHRKYVDGEKHLFRGNESALRIVKSAKPYCIFSDSIIELGTPYPGNSAAVRQILYQAYRREANKIFPETLKEIIREKESYGFKVSRLNIRTMKSRWGSCSNRGAISLNTELIRLPDRFTRYVILHELCHLKHHNHGTGFYELLSGLCPEWKEVRKELKGYLMIDEGCWVLGAGCWVGYDY